MAIRRVTEQWVEEEAGGSGESYTAVRGFLVETDGRSGVTQIQTDSRIPQYNSRHPSRSGLYADVPQVYLTGPQTARVIVPYSGGSAGATNPLEQPWKVRWYCQSENIAEQYDGTGTRYTTVLFEPVEPPQRKRRITLCSITRNESEQAFDLPKLHVYNGAVNADSFRLGKWTIPKGAALLEINLGERIKFGAAHYYSIEYLLYFKKPLPISQGLVAQPDGSLKAGAVGGPERTWWVRYCNAGRHFLDDAGRPSQTADGEDVLLDKSGYYMKWNVGAGHEVWIERPPAEQPSLPFAKLSLDYSRQ